MAHDRDRRSEQGITSSDDFVGRRVWSGEYSLAAGIERSSKRDLAELIDKRFTPEKRKRPSAIGDGGERSTIAREDAIDGASRMLAQERQHTIVINRGRAQAEKPCSTCDDGR